MSILDNNQKPIQGLYTTQKEGEELTILPPIIIEPINQNIVPGLNIPNYN